MSVVVVTLLAAFSMQLGYFLWKISADDLPRIGEVALRSAIRAFISSPRWLAGMFATTIGWLLMVKATDLGEVSLVQPLMSVGDLFLVVVAVTYLHERLKPVEWFGLSLTIIGAVILASEAAVIEPKDIKWMRLVLYLCLVLVIFLYLLSVDKQGKRREVMLSIMVGLAFGTGAVLTELFTASITFRGEQLESVAFFLNPILPAMVVANMLGVGLLQAAFQQGRAAVVIPVQLAIANGLVVIAGAIVFEESISWVRLAGVCIVIAGAAMLHRLADEERIRLDETV